MEDQDQVSADVETPVDDTEALDVQDDTQGDAPVSSPSEDAGTTAESAAPSVDDEITRLRADNERANRGYRDMQSRAERAEGQLRPHLEREQRAIEARMNDDTVLAKDCDDNGYARTHRKMAREEAEDVVQRAMEARDGADQGRINRGEDNKVYDKMRAQWSESGRPAAEFEPFMREQNGFAGISRKTAMENFTLLLGGKEALSTTSKAREEMARDAQKRAERVNAGQPVRNETIPGTQPGTANAGDKVLQGIGKAVAQLTSVDEV